MEIDDGSGPLRVVAGAALDLDRSALTEGAWIEVIGVLGQETSGAQPTRGYRIWPRAATDVRVTAGATDPEGDGPGGADGSGGSGSETGGGPTLGDLGDLDGSAAAGAVGATLVVARWPELGLGGLLWDGERLVALLDADASRILTALGSRRPPAALALRGLQPIARHGGAPLPVVELGEQPDAVLLDDGPAVPPSTVRPAPGDPPRWYATVGHLEGSPGAPRLRTSTGVVPIDWRCDGDERPPRGLVTASGIALPGRDALLVPCGGIRAGSTLARSGVRTELELVGHPAMVTPTGGMAPAPSTALAAGLLGAAAIVLTGAVAWLRWRPDDPSPDPSEPAEGADDERPAGPSVPTPSAPPVLTLVSLPHERAP